MAFFNPRFSIPGNYSGEAASWRLEVFTGVEVFAGFGPVPPRAWEDFERWHELWMNLDDVDITRAFFDPNPEAVEDFEERWDNDFYYFELPTGRILPALFDGNTAEGFETGWQNDSFGWEWADVRSVDARFGGFPYESFETGWKGNESFIWRWEELSSETARFDGGIKPYENFSGDWDE